MSAYIGPLGGLVEVAHYKGSVSSSVDRAVSFKRTLGGSNRAFVSPNKGLREWDVSADWLSPGQYGPFELLVSYGTPPFVFVDPLAATTNVLTRRWSMPGAGNEFAFTGGVAGSAAIPGVGNAPAVLQTSGNVDLATGAPVVPGKPVTGSVWVQGGAAGSVTLKFLNSAGTLTHSEVVNHTFGGWERVSVSGAAVAGDHSARITVNSGSQFYAALPAISWTKTVQEWSPGRGAYQTVVSGLQDSISLAGNQQFKSLSFKVTEVGTGA